MKDVASCDTDEDSVSECAYILRDYLQEQNEANLNRLSESVRKLVERKVTPEAILAVHFQVVRDMMKELSAVERTRLVVPSFQCLSQVLTDYCLAVTERLKSEKLEYDQIRKHIYLLEKRGRELVSKTEHQGKTLLSGRPSQAISLGWLIRLGE